MTREEAATVAAGYEAFMAAVRAVEEPEAIHRSRIAGTDRLAAEHPTKWIAYEVPACDSRVRSEAAALEELCGRHPGQMILYRFTTDGDDVRAETLFVSDDYDAVCEAWNGLPADVRGQAVLAHGHPTELMPRHDWSAAAGTDAA